MRLIDADELKEGLEQHFKSTDEYELDGIDHAFNRGYNSGLERALFSIIHAKVVDAVEVVRCHECIMHNKCNTEEAYKLCRIENPFCYAGKRREPVKPPEEEYSFLMNRFMRQE